MTVRSEWGICFFLLLAGLSFGPVKPLCAQQLLTNDSEKIDFAQGLLSQGQYNLAVAQFNEFIEQFPQSTFLPDAYLGAGECQFFLTDYDKAIEQLQKYLTLFPDGKSKGIAQVRLAQAYYIKENLPDSLKLLDETNLESLTPQFKQTLYFFKGQILAAQNKRDEAVANLQLAAELPEAQSYTAQAYLKWGAMIVEGDQAAALDKYAKALEKADTDELKASVLMRQGEAYFLMKKYDEASQIFLKVMEAYPGLPILPDAMANWYSTLISQKKYDPIIANFNQQLKGSIDKPEYFQTYVLAARATAALGNIDGALTMLDQIAALAGVPERQKSDIILQKTKILFDSGKFKEVAVFVDGKVSEAPGIKSDLLMLKAKAYLNLKVYDFAWETYELINREFANDPVAAQALYGMAYVRFGQEQYEQAAGIFMDCFNKAQDDTLKKDAIYNAFLTYKKANLENKVVEVAQQYLALTPAASHQAEVALALSGIYTMRQQFEKATELLQPYLNDPDETNRRNAVFQSAYNLQYSGKSDEALAGYAPFLTDGKNDRLTYLAMKNSCMIYLQNKDDDKAAELMQKAASEYADSDFSLKTYLWLVEHWQAKGDAQKMLDVLALAEKKYAQDPEALSIKFFMGQSYRMQDNCKQALGNYDLVLAAEKWSVYKGRARLGKGACLTGLGDYPGAQKELEQAVVDSPDDAFVAMRARFALAHNAELLKNFDMAVKLYLVVDVLYNDKEYAPKSLMRAGAIFEEQLNNKKEALTAYEKIVQMYPDSPEAAKAQEKVLQLK